MPIVHTIGYTQKSLERFVRLLQSAGVEAVGDIRLTGDVLSFRVDAEADGKMVSKMLVSGSPEVAANVKRMIFNHTCFHRFVCFSSTLNPIPFPKNSLLTNRFFWVKYC